MSPKPICSIDPNCKTPYVVIEEAMEYNTIAYASSTMAAPTIISPTLVRNILSFIKGATVTLTLVGASTTAINKHVVHP